MVILVIVHNWLKKQHIKCAGEDSTWLFLKLKESVKMESCDKNAHGASNNVVLKEIGQLVGEDETQRHTLYT